MPFSDDLTVALARLGTMGHAPETAIRPVLLRAVVDLFVQKTHHAPADVALFEAMIGPLLAGADPDTRQAVAERLAAHPAASRGLIEALLDDESLVAADLYRYASLGADELLATAEEAPALVAVMVAQRADLPALAVQALARRPEPRIVQALLENPDAEITPVVVGILMPRVRGDVALADLLAVRAPDPLAMAPLFPRLSPRGRRVLLDGLRRLGLGRRARERAEVASTATIAQVDRLVLGGEWDSVDHTLCLALGCDPRGLRPLLHDGTGDVLALALAALGVPVAVAVRAFLLGDASVARSVPTVRRLTALVDQVSPALARQFVLAMLDARPEEARRPAPRPATSPGRRPEADTAAVRREGVEPAIRKARA